MTLCLFCRYTHNCENGMMLRFWGIYNYTKMLVYKKVSSLNQQEIFFLHLLFVYITCIKGVEMYFVWDALSGNTILKMFVVIPDYSMIIIYNSPDKMTTFYVKKKTQISSLVF